VDRTVTDLGRSAGDRGAPATWTPAPAELDDLELLLLGAYAPLTGFLGCGDATSVRRTGRLVDGTPWPVAIELEVPTEVALLAEAAGVLRLTDEEGAPVGEVAVWEHCAGRPGHARLGGDVRRLGPPARGAYPSLRRPAGGQLALDGPPDPVDSDSQTGSADPDDSGGPVLGVPLDRPLDYGDLAALRGCAGALRARVLLLPLVGHGYDRGRDLDAAALVRTALGVTDLLGAGAMVIPVAVPAHGDRDADRRLLVHVAAAYGATHVLGPVPHGPAPLPLAVATLPALHDRAAAGTAGAGTAGAGREGAGRGDAPPAVQRELRRAHRGGVGGRGVTVLLTGYSGSGKSTIARALCDALLERTDRTVTLLDGDLVRRLLSSELTFSREHRELNVRRIGYVAAEVTRHGGIAVCAPIAPYASTRAEVRGMVEAVGGFLLVHVDTALEVCEGRDRKGLYAAARAGRIGSFTGVSDPYEAPVDADLRIDTAAVPVADAVARILDALAGRGWVTVHGGVG
jgi:sulfate adenylyltransferase